MRSSYGTLVLSQKLMSLEDPSDPVVMAIWVCLNQRRVFTFAG